MSLLQVQISNLYWVETLAEMSKYETRSYLKSLDRNEIYLKNLRESQSQSKKRPIQCQTTSKTLDDLASTASGNQLTRKVKILKTSKLSTKSLKNVEVPKSFKDELHLEEDQCKTCQYIRQIKTEDMRLLCHRFKFCTTYSIYFQVVMTVEEKIGLGEDDNFIEENPSIFYPDRARSVCERAAKIWTNCSNVFNQAASLSNQLIGPDQIANYNCDDYEKHLSCLRRIASVVKADKEILTEIDNRSAWENFRHEKAVKMSEDRLGGKLRTMLEYEFEFPETFLQNCHKK